ncbi:MAG: hypothetical protein AAF656_10960 [Planctomycetota bacterium]
MPKRSRLIAAGLVVVHVMCTAAGALVVGTVGTPAGAELSTARSVFAAANAASGCGLPTDFAFNGLGQLAVRVLGVGGMVALLWPMLRGRVVWLLPLAVVTPSGFATWGTAPALHGVAVGLAVCTAPLWLARNDIAGGQRPAGIRGFASLIPRLLALITVLIFPVTLRVLTTGATATDSVWLTLLTLLHVGAVAIFVRPRLWLSGVLVLYVGVSAFLIATEANVPALRLLTLSASAASTGGTDVGPVNVSDTALLALAVTQTLAKCWALWLVWTFVPPAVLPPRVSPRPALPPDES